MGLHLAVVVIVASVQDRDGARLLLGRVGSVRKTLRTLWADGGYQGTLMDWVAARFRFRHHVVKRPTEQKGFAVLARRWVVECTVAWLSRHRRLNKDYERLAESSEPFTCMP